MQPWGPLIDSAVQKLRILEPDAFIAERHDYELVFTPVHEMMGAFGPEMSPLVQAL